MEVLQVILENNSSYLHRYERSTPFKVGEFYHYLYIITSLIPDKPYYYIGIHRTKFLKDGYFGSGTALLNVLASHGKKSFQFCIIGFVESYEQCKLFEKLLVGDLYKVDPWCLNCCEGGAGGNVGWVPSEEFRRQVSLVHKGKTISEEQKKRAALKHTGYHHTEENKRKMGLLKIGKKRSQSLKQKVSDTLRGKPLWTCSYCHLSMNEGNYKRWHGENCKHKNNIK